MSVPTLNRRLVLEAPQRVSDEAGGYTLIWQVLGSVWAQVGLRTGRETERLETPLSVSNYRITVRAVSLDAPERPRPEHRFRDGDRIYLIKAVAEADAFGRYLTCFATEERTL